MVSLLEILKYTLAICTLFLTDRFIHQYVIINTHFSPYPLFFGTSYQLISSWFLILTPLKHESARSIIHSLKCQNQADSDLLQLDLTALETWEETWQMSFNPSKCIVLRIAARNKKVLQSEYKLHGHILETEEASSYLGVTITDNLTWDKHIQNISNKGNRTLGFIRRNLRDCTVPVKAATYTAMVQPSLECASTVWDTPNQAHIKQLESVQRRAARYVYKDYHSRTPGCVTKMVENLNWEPLTARRKTNRLSMLYRIQHGLVDIPKEKYLHSSDSRTRGQHRFFQERIQDDSYKNSFFPRTVRDWNQLPARVVSATSLEEFRSLLRG